MAGKRSVRQWIDAQLLRFEELLKGRQERGFVKKAPKYTLDTSEVDALKARLEAEGLKPQGWARGEKRRAAAVARKEQKRAERMFR